ncbi:VOC family protein [Granulicoccus phenolivorans]|uniref:VOC family protein n=1 Tax=Granulicoccus phenolivorans TaxID=266854 RepID=UPI00040D58E0|nr:VOC family protein [Granulicoccus phenolivorans]
MNHPTQVAHVVYGTHRFEQMLEFYTVAFGDVVRMNNGRHAFLSFDHEHHRHALVNLGPEPESAAPAEAAGGYAARGGVRHVAYAWADLAALLQVYERLRDTLGVLPVKAVKHGPSLSIYYEDPDGNRSEFYVDVMSTDDAIAYMTTDIFVADPVGEGFDHQDFFARLARGEDVADRALRTPAERA